MKKTMIQPEARSESAASAVMPRYGPLERRQKWNEARSKAGDCCRPMCAAVCSPRRFVRMVRDDLQFFVVRSQANEMPRDLVRGQLAGSGEK